MADNPIHFGTDGWRGIIAEDFTFDRLRQVSTATAEYVKSNSPLGNGRVLIGYDRRFLAKEFAEEVSRVLAALNVPAQVSLTPMPTPAVSFSVAHRKASWGIMITASHNPALYNGFKIKEARGRSAPPEVTIAIEASLGKRPVPELDRVSSIPTFDDRKPYEKYLKSRLDWNALRSYAKPIVFDHLFGVGAGIPERVLAGSQFKIHSIHEAPDPLYGGLHPEPIDSQLTDLKRTVRQKKALVGIGLDGDADRLGVVDDGGRYMTPHQVFPLLVLHCIEHKQWRGKIVQAVSLGYLSERIAKEFNLPFEEVPVGFKHVAERMLNQDFLAGGEESGGYAVRGGLPERDGILNGLLFLEMLAVRRLTPSKLLASMEKRFGRACFERVDIHVKTPILDREAFAKAVSSRVPDRLAGERTQEVRTRDGVKVFLESGSWVLMRPSGTEPLIRTYSESDTPRKTQALLKWAQAVVNPS